MNTISTNELIEAVSDPDLYIFKPVGDGYYCSWKPNNNVDREWNTIFELTDPIQYHSLKEPTGKKTKKDVSHIWSETKELEQEELQRTGYMRPFLRFLKIRTFFLKEFNDDILATFEHFKDEDNFKDLIDKAETYRQALFTQIKRQAQQVEYINRKMTGILKGLFHEGVESILSEKQMPRSQEPNLMPDLRLFFRDAVLGGEYLDRFENYWIPKAILEPEHPEEPLKLASAQGLIKLARLREPELKIAENIGRQLLSIETIIERLLRGKDFTDWELAIRNMPDPYEVAKDFYDNAPNPKFEPTLVGEVMEMTRDFIFANDVTQENLNKSEICELVIQRGIAEPHPNAIKNWIDRYATFALST